MVVRHAKIDYEILCGESECHPAVKGCDNFPTDDRFRRSDVRATI